MENDILKVLISEEELHSRIAQLGEEITRDYAGTDPVILGVLKGVVVFYADMIRQIRVPCQMDFMCLSSYHGTQSTGNMVVRQDMSVDVSGRHVLILETSSTQAPLWIIPTTMSSAKSLPPFGSVPCWISRSAESPASLWCRIMWASPFPMSLWWAMDWTLMSTTGICPMWGF